MLGDFECVPDFKASVVGPTYLDYERLACQTKAWLEYVTLVLLCDDALACG